MSALGRGVERADHPPSRSSFIRSGTLPKIVLAESVPSAARACEFDHSDGPFQRHVRSSSPSLRMRGSRSGRVPRESPDAPEDLPKEAPRQLAFGQLKDEVLGMPDQTPTGLEGPLLEVVSDQLWMARGFESYGYLSFDDGSPGKMDLYRAVCFWSGLRYELHRRIGYRTETEDVSMGNGAHFCVSAGLPRLGRPLASAEL
jgi:hypothetical protein